MENGASASGHPVDAGTGLPRGAPRGSLGAIVGSYKAIVARNINRTRGTKGAKVWLRNYYERIIRNEEALARIRTYIRNNPRNWRGGSGGESPSYGRRISSSGKASRKEKAASEAMPRPNNSGRGTRRAGE